MQAFAVPASVGNATEDAIVQGLDGQEWFVVEGASGYHLAQATTSGTITSLPGSFGGNPGSGGFNWGLLDGPSGYVTALGGEGGKEALYAVNTTGETQVLQPSEEVRDIAFGPEGDLYGTESAGHIYRYVLTPTSSDVESTRTSIAAQDCVEPDAIGVEPDAIASVGGKLWFSDDDGELCSMTPSEQFAGPYETGGVKDQVSRLSHTLTAGAEGDIWAVSGGGISSAPVEVEQIDPADGAVIAKYGAAQGIAAGAKISSITAGPDGEIWFPESTESGVNAIGRIDPSTGTLTSYPLPSGFQLPDTATSDIAPGPEGTVWFTAQTTGGAAAVGEVSGLVESITTTTTSSTTSTTTTSTTSSSKTTSTATAGTLAIAGKAKVSSNGIASMTLTCKGASGATCKGKLTLTLKQKSKVKRKGKAKTVTKTVAIGSASYELTVPQRKPAVAAIVETAHAKVTVKLSKAALKLLDTAKGHTLKTTATAKPTSGHSVANSVTLVGAKAKAKAH